jgi:two-component system NtrC family sensor kinase
MKPGDILVVDDSLTSRTWAKLRLQRAGYQVREAETAQEALAAIARKPPDLVLLDVILPDMDGFEVTRRVRDEADLTTIPIVLVTALGDVDSKVEGLEAGANDFLTKPPDEAELMARVRTLLRLKQNQAELMAEKAKTELLYRVSRELSAELDLDTLLTQILDLTIASIGASGGSIILLSKQGKALRSIYIQEGRKASTDLVWERLLKEGLAGWVIQHRTGEIIPDTQQDERWIVGREMHKRTRSALAIPLTQKGRVVGVLTLTHKKDRYFTPDHLDLVSSIASQAAIVIEKAQLYSETEQERGKLSAILAGTSDVVVVIDDSGRILLLNPAAEHTFGVEERDATGFQLTERIPNQALEDLIQRRAQGTPPHIAEIPLPDKRTLYASVSPVESVGYVVVMQDITHLKELEQMKNEFVAAVSHDLRSPLSTIYGYAEMLVSLLEEETQEYARRIRVSAKQMAELVEDLLNLGRIEAGVETSREPHQLEVLVEQAVDSAGFQAELREIDLKLTISGELDPVSVDARQIDQVLDNLLGNALKYTTRGGTVVVRVWQQDADVTVEVHDTGLGIPREALPRIFEKFFRAPSPELKDIPGTGLGLAIVKAIVEQHNGQIWVESELGKGSTFGFSLPALRKTDNNE